MNKTKHFKQRMQQRGVNEIQCTLIQMFGTYHMQKGGTDLVYISEEDIKKIRKAIDKIENIAIVFGSGETGITVMHLDSKINHEHYAA